jgi:hypothetical protein
MRRSLTQWLRLFITLLLGWSALACSAVSITLATTTTAYDGRNLPSCGYDPAQQPKPDYDRGSALLFSKQESQLLAERALLAVFAEFVAAEGEGGPLIQWEFDFVKDLNAQRQGYGPLPAGEKPYQLTLFPDTPYDRAAQYGGSTTPEQRALAAPFSFDHDPSLVTHYYEGNGQGGLPGFNLTQTERIQQYESLNGNIVPRSMQNVQGRQMMDYSIQQKTLRGF